MWAIWLPQANSFSMKNGPASISPECMMLCCTKAGLLALLTSDGLPILLQNSGTYYQRCFAGLQQRGLLRFLTGFPFKAMHVAALPPVYGVSLWFMFFYFFILSVYR